MIKETNKKVVVYTFYLFYYFQVITGCGLNYVKHISEIDTFPG